MLECTFCKRIPKEGNIENLDLEMKNLIKENNYKYFKCECENEWVEVNSKTEFFNLNLFNKELRTFDDFNNLIMELDKDLQYYHVTPLIKDCLSRINNWLVTGGNINDLYIRNLLNNLKSIDF